ncbi:O-antigen ligase family protein, partial [Burkholderia gladioli]|uniref:O-antigen ligase family protein n=1 Tax=Burkholderia gladioli TaxID=28095 RepID=UPI003C79BD9E
MKTIGLVLVAVAACVIAFGVFSGAAQRLVSVYTETSQWMNQSNPDTSGGMRLTMWKIAVALFVHNPLRGYGDVGFRAYLDALVPGQFGIVLGDALAGNLGVTVGDKITLVAPEGTITPAGMMPRLKQFTVVGVFE